MLHQFTYLLFKLKLTQPSEGTIRYWANTNAIVKLEYTLIHGNHKTRQLAAEALEKVGKLSSIPILLNAINDKIQNVSIAALNALETLGCNSELIILITRKRFNWVKEQREKEKRQKHKAPSKHSIYRWNRSSKKSFDLVKERLKKPIR